MSAEASRDAHRSCEAASASRPNSENPGYRKGNPRRGRNRRPGRHDHRLGWSAASLFGLVFLLVAAPIAAAAPTIAITSPSGASTLIGSTLTVSGTATNATKVTVCIDGTGCQDASGVASWSVTFDISGLSEGSHTVRACAISGTTEQCATLALTISHTYTTVQTVLEDYVTPALTVVAIVTAVAVALRPRSFRTGSSVATSLGALVIVDLALRGLTSSGPEGYYLSAGFLAAALVVNRAWRPKPRRVTP